MQALRGAMVDAECPRCGTTSPPPESLLATCKRCCLVFTPHEVQHKLPTRVEPEVVPAALPPPPPHVSVHREGSSIAVMWPLARYVTAFVFSAGLLLAYLAVDTDATTLRRSFWLGVTVAAVFGVIQLFAHHVLTIGPKTLEHHISFTIGTRTVLALDRAVRIEIRKERWAMHELHLVSSQRLARTLLARSSDAAPLAYAADLIATRMRADSADSAG